MSVRFTMAESFLALGLVSDTSGDGVDVALLETDGEQRIEFLSADTLDYPDDVRERLLDAAQRDVPLIALLRLERKVTQHHARAVRRLLAENDIVRNVA